MCHREREAERRRDIVDGMLNPTMWKWGELHSVSKNDHMKDENQCLIPDNQNRIFSIHHPALKNSMT